MDSSLPSLERLSLPRDDGRLLAAERILGGEPHVLLAHGFGQTRQSWSATQHALAKLGLGSTVFDARGHGESDRNPEDSRYQHEQLIDDVRRVSAACPSEKARPVLVGASMGGLCGLVAQSRRPLFSALVLVDVTPRWEDEGLRRILDFMRAHPQGFESFEHAADEIALYLPHRRERKTPQQLRPLLRQGEDGRLRWHWDPRLLSEFAENSSHLQDEIGEAARAIRVPTLLISGGRSDLVSQQTVQHFLDCVPHARHVQLPQATHMLAGDDNQAFTRAVAEFLGEYFPLPQQSRPFGVAV